VEKKPTALFTCPCDSRLFLFSTLKNTLKGSKFHAVDGVRRNVTAEFNAVLVGAFNDLCETVIKW